MPGLAASGPINPGVRWVSAGAPHAPTLASSVELRRHACGALRPLQALDVLLEWEHSERCLASPWVGFPCDGVQLQRLLPTLELLHKRELVQLLVRLVQLRRAWRCGE